MARLSGEADLPSRVGVLHARAPASQYVPRHVQHGKHSGAGDLPAGPQAAPDQPVQPSVRNPLPAGERTPRSRRRFPRAPSRGKWRTRWVRWNHAFSLLQLKSPEEARTELVSLAESARDPVLQLLSAYLLDVVSRIRPWKRTWRSCGLACGNAPAQAGPREDHREVKRQHGGHRAVADAS